MKRTTRRVLLVGAVVLGVVVVTGTAIAASSGSGASPSAFLDSLAKHLGVSRAKLDDAARAAAVDQVDAARAAGTITEKQETELKQRIESGEAPLLRPWLGFGHGRGFGHGLELYGGPHLFGGLAAAAEYLGLGEEELRNRLADGKSLAEIAQAEGKSVDGLKQALLAETKQRVAGAVKDGRLTEQEAAELLERATERVDRLVEGTFDRHSDGMWGRRSLRGAPSSSGLIVPGWRVPA